MAISPVSFLQEVRAELAKVVWPTRDQAVKLTIVVIGVSAGLGAFIGLLDVIFTKVTELVVK